MSCPDFLTLLLLPETAETSTWLELAARTLPGYQPQPTVVRRTRTEGAPEHLEVRRWSPEPYTHLGAQLLLSPEGGLFLSRLEAVRHLRRRADSTIEDEIYELVSLPEPSREQLELVRSACLALLVEEGYTRWADLSWEQRLALARFGGSGEQANQALALSSPADRLGTLQLLVGEEAHPELRAAVQELARQGGLKAGIEVVPWLLGQSDWNLCPDKVALARSAVQDDPTGAWELRSHPNAMVRLRLVDLIELSEFDWLEWLARETDPAVRDRLRQSLERLYTPAQIVEKLMQEKQAMRREALGWVLVHWKGDIQRSDDIKALNRALSARLGGENKSRLRGKLSRMGQLELKARLFTR